MSLRIAEHRWTRRRRTAVAIAAGLLGVAGAWAADATAFKLKPGATGKVCLECHVTFEETRKLPSVHTPVKNGECADCHSPHAASHGALLAADPKQICADCHQGIIPGDAKSVHQVVLEGNCTTCHDPHGAKNANNLIEAANDLCLGCHDTMAAAIASATVAHAPVRSGCVRCHDPHASTASDALLKTAMPELCAGCHNTTAPGFAKQHMNYPVGKSRCTSCHDPHGSSVTGMLWASAHKPVVNKMCAQCHEDASSPTALQTKSRGVDLCRACHSNMVNETFGKDRLHWPTADRQACLNCHSPHASRYAPLLSKDEGALCGSCHEELATHLAEAKEKHPPAVDGACATCHDPHASNQAYLIASDSSIEICQQCHDYGEHSSHPIGAEAVDMRNPNVTLDCMSCHDAHASNYKHIALADTEMDLCVQCHEGLTR